MKLVSVKTGLPREVIQYGRIVTVPTLGGMTVVVKEALELLIG
jgi:hypothetical protein